MGGAKEKFEIDLNSDHLEFLRRTREQYGLADEGKTLRIIMDYVITNPGSHSEIFTQVRCLRCE